MRLLRPSPQRQSRPARHPLPPALWPPPPAPLPLRALLTGRGLPCQGRALTCSPPTGALPARALAAISGRAEAVEWGRIPETPTPQYPAPSLAQR